MRGAPKGVRIQGVDGLMVRYSQCCQPVPGDPVVGYVTRGRGVSIHRADCPNVLSLSTEPERRLEHRLAGSRRARASSCASRSRAPTAAGCTRMSAEAVTGSGTNIKSVELRSGDGGGVSGSMLVEVENLDASRRRSIRVVRKVKGITDVARRERHAGEEQ